MLKQIALQISRIRRLHEDCARLIAKRKALIAMNVAKLPELLGAVAKTKEASP